MTYKTISLNLEENYYLHKEEKELSFVMIVVFIFKFT